MTVLRNNPDALSNWFNKILDAAGHRGSSFCDVDGLIISALTHDGVSKRFLFQEFKRPGEECSLAQWKALYALSFQPSTTVWLVQQVEGLESVAVRDFRNLKYGEILQPVIHSLASYRQKFVAWWDGTDTTGPPMFAVDVHFPWAEHVERDPSLRAFVESEILRATVGWRAAQVELAHYRQLVNVLEQRIKLLDAKRREHA